LAFPFWLLLLASGSFWLLFFFPRFCSCYHR
jgi:hypothetical protein